MSTLDAPTAVLTAAIEERSALGIATAVSRLINAKDLAAGVRLPTVRDLALALSVSPTTVSQAWQSLAQHGLIESRGRSGTRVVGPRPRTRRTRFAQLGPPGPVAQDLSSGIPDAELLPPLTAALSRISGALPVFNYQEPPVLPELEALLIERWPYQPEAVTVTDGALDALDHLLGAMIRFGDRVLVENPTYPAIIDLIEAYGASAIGLHLDGEGVVPHALAEAIDRYQPVAVIVQPRAHNPTGQNMSRGRVRELSMILARSNAAIIEDDHIGDVASGRPVSFGALLPGRTLRISSFSKSHGPDLRLAAVGGPRTLTDGLVGRRQLGPGWSSRLLQSVLFELLTDADSVDSVATAQKTYARRRRQLIAQLSKRGVNVSGTDGLNLWVAVKDEQSALLVLATAGIAVAPGRPFFVTPLESDYVRVTCAAVRVGYSELADLIAAASHATARRRAR